jgi:hypothetical protein
VNELREALDEGGETSDMICYLSALIRSADEVSVRTGLCRIREFGGELDSEERKTIEFLRVLALYRLREDKEALIAAEQAKANGWANKETGKILEQLLKVRRDERLEIAVAAGIGGTILAGLAAGLAFLLRGKRK